MRKAAWLIAAVAFFFPLSLLSEDGDYYDRSFARVTYVKGDAIVQRAGDLGTEEATVNLAVVEGDKVDSRNGRVEIHLGRRNYLRLDQNSTVEFSNLPRRGDDRTRLHLLSGRIYLRIAQLDEEKAYEVHTPDASFYVLEEGLYRFEMRAGQETELAVLEGSIEAAGEEGSQLVGSRESLIASNGHLGSQTTLAYSRDDFDYWNDDRDSLHSQYASKRYLSEDMADYESELSDNGNWVYERPYGYVWAPSIYDVDWRPYYYGRWVWYPICGWTWISSEPWGWATYHYGRWGWRIGLGWYWIPHRAWGPAWVHWYWGDDYWGWAPLSWYNYPVVIVNNYFYDRYHYSRYPAGSWALTVVHKNSLQDRNISHAALSHIEASRLGDIKLDARQPDTRPTITRAGLRGAESTGSLSRPQIRPSNLSRSQGARSLDSPTRIERSSSLRQGQTVSGKSRSETSERAPARSVTPSSVRARSARESEGSSAQAPRKIRSDTGSLSRRSSVSSRSEVRTYSSSPRVSSGPSRSTVERRTTPRAYSSSSRISRYGTSYGLRSSHASEPRSSSLGQTRVREWGSTIRPRSQSQSSYSPSRSFSSPSASRRQSFSGVRSFSGSSSRSAFSAPRSSFSGGSRSSSPSFSRSSSSPSSSSRSSAPRSSSSSRGSSGGSVRRKG